MTVTPSFSKAIVAVLAPSGITVPDALCQEIQQYPAEQRLPMSVQDRLWQAIEPHCKATTGFDIGSRLQPDHYDMLGFLVLSCTRLSQAADMLVSYSRLVGEGGRFYKERTEQGWRLGYQAQFSTARQLRLQAILASVLNGVRHVTETELAPLEVGMEWPEPDEYRPYRKLFKTARLKFSQPSNYLVFSDTEWWQQRRHNSPELQQHMVKLAELQLRRLQPETIADKVRTILQQQPWLGRSQVAEALAMSERHLNRKLKPYGFSFKSLTEEVKKQRLQELLVNDQRISQSHLADYFGYADESAFAKAFKRWMGMNLSQYRQREEQ
ncbi:hypothetical protein HMF8227_01709 [Saliniradius amylolyticus]|uniref:HTH araC/xylS-type domain-containing protein n=1 Tax=Saliniradius amylolyticus TaxID=2183582 RepID=A0A2S2E3T8_9ALTE|nr:AraC family transcriptional regulator [Saliniradius amylolyticus]AWL12182.1 hypothetical protein HMF8227_01709 [Saliniradius amylolyticus]